jgi:hypothetical protein
MLGQAQCNRRRYLDKRNGLDALSVIIDLPLKTLEGFIDKLGFEKQANETRVSKVGSGYDTSIITDLFWQDKDECCGSFDSFFQIGYAEKCNHVNLIDIEGY